MAYKLIKPTDGDDIFDKEHRQPIVFMGGNCRGRDWRLDFFPKFDRYDLTFINPKRDKFASPEGDPAEHANQVMWERKAIDACDIAMFWLGEGLANQASRVEIGYALGKGKTVIIGAEQGFLGLEHLSAFSGLILTTSIDGLMSRLESLLLRGGR